MSFMSVAPGSLQASYKIFYLNSTLTIKGHYKSKIVIFVLICSGINLDCFGVSGLVLKISVVDRQKLWKTAICLCRKQEPDIQEDLQT